MKIINFSLLGILLLVFNPFLHAQNEVISLCGTESVDDTSLEKGYEKYIQQQEKTLGDCTLPIVIHIIHDNEEENISDAQVLQGIEQLNKAFANTGYYDQNTGVNTDIQFCLAQRTPDETPTSGINRLQSDLTEMTVETQDIALKNLIRWQPTEYINIWLVREICSQSQGCTVAGYASKPYNHGSTKDGIVLEARWFGADEGTTTLLIHEMGHYLGLYHTFKGGCTNDDCLTDGDRVCDTPPDQSIIDISCGESINSCDTDTNSGFTYNAADMYWNYMDYGDRNCFSAFTQGQADRMAYFIENKRSSLLASSACSPPCSSPLTANFEADTYNIAIGTTLSFENTSTNAAHFEWFAGEILFSESPNATYTFSNEGNFAITLIANNEDENCEQQITISVNVYCPAQAGFEVNNYYPIPGDTLIFTNTSTESLAYQWTLNDSLISLAENLTLTLEEEGVYQLCLEVTSEYCQHTYCDYLSVNESYNDCLNAPLITRLSTPDMDESPCGILHSNDGQFYQWSTFDNSLSITKFNIIGQFVWQRSLPLFSSTEYTIRDMILDRDGMLVGFGSKNTDQFQGLSSYFKYDPITDELLWHQKLQAGISAKMIIEDPVDPAYYLFYNKANGDALVINGQGSLLKVDSETGMPFEPQAGFRYTSPDQPFLENTTFNSVSLHNNYFYALGGSIPWTNSPLNARGMTMTKLDMNGNFLWSKKYSYNLFSPVGRLEGKDFVIEGDACFAVASVVNNQDSPGTILIKLDLDGNLIWKKRFDLLDGASQQIVENILSVEDGFILYGTTQNKSFLFKTDKEGHPLWSKIYNFPIGSPASTKIIQAGNAFFFTGKMDNDILLIKTDLQGNSQKYCDKFESLDFTEGAIDEIIQEEDLMLEKEFFLPNSITPTTIMPVENVFLNIEIPDCNCEDVIKACDSTFVKTIGFPNKDVIAKKIIESESNGFILAGSKGDSSLICSIDQQANLIWEKTIDFWDGKEEITDLLKYYSTYLVGIGSTISANNKRSGFSFNISSLNNYAYAWKNEPENKRIEYNQNILDFTGKIGRIIDLETGQKSAFVNYQSFPYPTAINKYFSLGGNETFHKGAGTVSNGFYLVGSLGLTPGDQSNIRGFLFRQGATYVPYSNIQMIYFVPSNEPAWIVTKDIINNNGLLTYSHGNLTGTDPTNTELIAAKLNYNGNILWAKHYDIQDGNNARAVKALKLPFNYVFIGTFKRDEQTDIFIFVTDKSGHIDWAKSIGGQDDETAYDILYKDRFLYLLGSSKSFNATHNEEMLLAKINIDGETLNASCADLKNLDIKTYIFEDPFESSFEWNDSDTIQSALTEQTSISNESTLQDSSICLLPCCESLPDGFIGDISWQCAGDSLLLSIDICNDNVGALERNTPIAIYDNNPTVVNSSLLKSMVLPQTVLKDSCRHLEVRIPNTNHSIYVVVNDIGTIDRPYNLEADLFGSPFQECVFYNNMDSLSLDLDEIEAPILDLGADTLICDNGVASLDAGRQFHTYLWQDGSNQPNFTTWDAGLYWVEVTDSCGRVQSDTIEVRVLPASILNVGADTTICEGAELIYTPQGFDYYEWQPNQFLDCNDCNSVTIRPDHSIDYTIIAQKAPGCFSMDTLHIEVIANDLLLQLPNDTSIFLGDQYQLDLYSNISDIQSIQWSPPYQISCTDCLQPIVAPLQTTTYSASIVDGNNCEVSDEVRISIRKDRRVFIPNAFSPNGDQVNDLLLINGGPDVERFKTFQIYNRWGDLILDWRNFSPNDNNYSWDGTFNGKLLNAGVYVYYLEVQYLNGEEEILKGDVLLIR